MYVTRAGKKKVTVPHRKSKPDGATRSLDVRMLAFSYIIGKHVTCGDRG